MIKTVSLPTAKLLKDAGFRQKTSFFWCYHCMGGMEDYYELYYCKGACEGEFSAPCTDELLESINYGISIRQIVQGYVVQYKPTRFKIEFRNKSLPEALALMWLHLHKNNIIKT